MDVFERVLPKITAPNHSMLGSYPIHIDPAPYLEYTRAYSRAYWHVKKRVRMEKSNIEGSKKYHFCRKPIWAGLNDCPTILGA